MKNIRNSMQAGTDAGSVSPENDSAYISACLTKEKSSIQRINPASVRKEF
ncbi:hypothetical protein B4123_4321 [Bacillus paralicheniformis]|uniref:Uncharacterized protein n=1 Tax=Bacillus paralicheniformis TaxID=1648923 RepID=A0A6I7TTI7_9BACI|nr:hypothetical protein SC10_B2orf01007 [Bacillus paralicheniformis]KUL08192.1 hypothetical protein LI7559_15560 [Bacillus licheniformis LMG 7559]KUL15157.1 hypothetical protein LI6934_21560 [Bacillus licheniformis LMG 6934]OLF92774.1 hypothetical protein B4121_2462 [Bacillus paralicheniformis]OLG02947.1 hypothetical protein B4123_4321 [Bacillus paralicheniformis]